MFYCMMYGEEASRFLWVSIECVGLFVLWKFWTAILCAVFVVAGGGVANAGICPTVLSSSCVGRLMSVVVLL